MPKPDQELLLEAVLLRGAEAIRAWKKWSAAHGVAASDRPSRRLFPALYRNLLEAGSSGDDLGPLHDAYEKSRREVEERLSAARPAIAALAAAGIEPLLLKGAALTRFYGGDAALRPMRDIDVLVRPGETERAAAALAPLGYEPAGIAPSCFRRYAFRVSPSWPFVAPNAPDVDLHWNVLHESRQPGADDAFWQDAVPLDFQGLTVQALNSTDQLLHVCVHGLQREPQENLRWIVDAFAILRHPGEPINWARLVEQVVWRRLVLQARSCIEYLAGRFAAPIPPQVLERLRGARVSSTERMEFRARSRAEGRDALEQAVLSHQDEVRRAGGGSQRGFLSSLPRHLWGARRWWQMPLWKALDRVGVALPPGTRFARAVFAAAPDPVDPAAAPAYAAGERLFFGRGGSGLAALRSGWSYAESAGVWSEGIVARLELLLREVPPGPLRLQVELGAAMVDEAHPELDVHVLLDASRVARWRLTAPFAGPVTREAVLPSGLVASRRSCTIDFRILRPRSPASLGSSRDQRRLGIHLSALRLGPDAVA
jgi:hypothetical protein